jgi:hypothetical protein
MPAPEPDAGVQSVRETGTDIRMSPARAQWQGDATTYEATYGVMPRIQDAVSPCPSPASEGEGGGVRRPRGDFQ